jgi:hypothetical protein
MKKALSAFLSVLLFVGVFSMSVFADETSAFAFDNDSGLSYWQSDNEELSAQTGFKYSISDDNAFSGAGSLAVYESFTGDIDPSLAGGAYITSDRLGLANFAGCTISAKLYPTSAAISRGAEYIMYTDGMLYLPSSQTTFTPDTWNDISLTVPTNCENTRFGFLVPVYSTFSGDAFYLDELKITLPDGVTVSNVGDFQVPVESEESGGGISDGLAGLLYALLIIGGIAVLTIVGFLIYRRTKRYR